jgi:retinol dehydrogenase-12
MGNQFSQAFPPEAKLTEKNLPDQAGKVHLPPFLQRILLTTQQVFIVTGSSSGVGKELAQILYSHNAKVYLAARSAEKTNAAIESIKTAFPNSKGEAIYLHLDLNDLTTIKASANEFLSKEDKLNVLWNNAGVMIPPQGSKTKQGYELQLGTNNVAPFLFTKLLTPILIKTAKMEAPGTVRVVWTSSSWAEGGSPKNGVDMNNLNYKTDKSAWQKYGVSKAGNILHSKEFANRYEADGLISVVSEVVCLSMARLF